VYRGDANFYGAFEVQSSPYRRHFFVLGVLLFLASCTRPVTEAKFVTAQPRFDLLIASDASDFKNHLRERIIAHYRPYGNIEVINIADLPGRQTAAFDAVLVMDTCMGGSRFNPSIKTFLDQHPEPQKVVLLMTADTIDWSFRYQDVDAVTAASAVENETPLFLTLKGRLDHIIMTKGGLP